MFLCHLCDHPHSLTCPVVIRLFIPRLLLLNIIIFGHGVTDGPGPAQPRLRGNFLCRRDWIPLREAARSEWAILPAQEVAAYPWCGECKPLRSSGPRRVGLAGTMSGGAHGMVQAAQTVSATQNQNAATWKDSDLRPCSSTA